MEGGDYVRKTHICAYAENEDTEHDDQYVFQQNPIVFTEVGVPERHYFDQWRKYYCQCRTTGSSYERYHST